MIRHRNKSEVCKSRAYEKEKAKIMKNREVQRWSRN